jgi:mannose-6-phosphate isomerase-like protein (cupin superfamily)
MADSDVQLKKVMDEHSDIGEWLKVWPDERFAIRIPSATSQRRYVTLESVAVADAGPPLHIHHNEDEHFIILEGSMRFQRGDETFIGHAGETITVPRGVLHTWRVCSDIPARMLVTFSPGGFERAFEALVGAPPSEAEAILNRFGCTIEGGRIE